MAATLDIEQLRKILADMSQAIVDAKEDLSEADRETGDGDHKRIALWQFEQSLLLTKARRPDLFDAYLKNTGNLTREQRKILEKVIDMM